MVEHGVALAQAKLARAHRQQLFLLQDHAVLP